MAQVRPDWPDLIPLPPADANSLDDAVVMTPMLDQRYAAMVSMMQMVITGPIAVVIHVVVLGIALTVVVGVPITITIVIVIVSIIVAIATTKADNDTAGVCRINGGHSTSDHDHR